MLAEAKEEGFSKRQFAIAEALANSEAKVVGEIKERVQVARGGSTIRSAGRSTRINSICSAPN